MTENAPIHDREIEFSVVIPVHNEEASIYRVIEELQLALAQQEPRHFEIVVVDDGSTDMTGDRADDVASRLTELKIIRHERCLGKSAAIMTGIAGANGAWIGTIDGDGQNDPKDLVRLWTLVREQAAAKPVLAMGRRRSRVDPLSRRIASHMWNLVLRVIVRQPIYDTSCGLAAFRRSDFIALPKFNHMHRFLPMLFVLVGGEVMWLDIQGRPRLGGRSHFSNGGRVWQVAVDLCGVLWLMSRRVPRPKTP